MQKIFHIVRWGMALLLVLFMAGASPVQGLAEGGSVKSNAEISFYEDESPITDSSDASGTGTGKSPDGNLLQTNELVNRSLMISGVVLLMIFLIILFRRKRKEDDKHEKRHP